MTVPADLKCPACGREVAGGSVGQGQVEIADAGRGVADGLQQDFHGRAALAHGQVGHGAGVQQVGQGPENGDRLVDHFQGFLAVAVCGGQDEGQVVPDRGFLGFGDVVAEQEGTVASDQLVGLALEIEEPGPLQLCVLGAGVLVQGAMDPAFHPADLLRGGVCALLPKHPDGDGQDDVRGQASHGGFALVQRLIDGPVSSEERGQDNASPRRLLGKLR